MSSSPFSSADSRNLPHRQLQEESTSGMAPPSCWDVAGCLQLVNKKSNCFSQLREEFDQGWEVQMDEENAVHDVAALLKEFFRDLPDPLLTRDLYTAFLNTTRKTKPFQNQQTISSRICMTFDRGLFFSFLSRQCWTIRSRRRRFSCSSFCFLRATATHCAACSACCPPWLLMQRTAWTARDTR